MGKDLNKEIPELRRWNYDGTREPSSKKSEESLSSNLRKKKPKAKKNPDISGEKMYSVANYLTPRMAFRYSAAYLKPILNAYGLPRNSYKPGRQAGLLFTHEPTAPDILRLFLLTGAYGDFPAITLPNVDITRWVSDIQDFNIKTDILNIRNYVVNTVPDINWQDTFTHKRLYSVVNFLTCLRNEVITADLYFKNISWNPLVSLTMPFYYQKGTMRNWVSDNNILKAEIVEWVYDVYHLLITAYKRRLDILEEVVKPYNFFVQTWSADYLQRINLFDYIQEDDTKNIICLIVSYMKDSIDLLDAMLKRKAYVKKEEINDVEQLGSTLQYMFVKIQRMIQYVIYL